MVVKMRGVTYMGPDAISEDSSSTKLATGFTYSATEEIDTGNKWIDGNRVMRKYISLGTLPNNATKTVSFGVTGMLRMLSLTGTAWRGDGVSIPLPTAFIITAITPGNVAVWFSLDDTVRIVTTSDMSTFTGILIAEYVKV